MDNLLYKFNTNFVGVRYKFAVENVGEPNKEDDEGHQNGSSNVGSRFENVIKLNPAQYCHFNHEEQDAQYCRTAPCQLDVDVHFLVRRFIYKTAIKKRISSIIIQFL